MSNPVNPLDKYRSHSVHYILVVGNKTTSIQPYIDTSSASSAKFLTDVASKKLGEEISKELYLLVDSRRTSEFSISHIDFTTFMTSGVNTSAATVVDAAINMTLLDPSGIGFYNYLKFLIDTKLKTDPTGLVFMLNISFIGHTFEGATEPVDSISIPLIMGDVFSLSEISTKGGVYDLNFFPITATMGSKTSYMQLGNNITFKATHSLLGEAIRAFENRLNSISKDFFNNYVPIEKSPDQSISENQVKSNSQSGPKKGRLVQYMITIPEQWYKFHLPTSPEKVREINFVSNEQIDVDSANSSSNTILSTVSNDTIQEAINTILLMSSGVTNLASRENKEQGKAKTFKILTSATSDDETVVVHFDVVEYAIKDANNKKPVVSDNKSSKSVSDQNKPEGAIEFDYIFSGKNTDILDFNLKIDNLYVALLSNPIVGVEATKQIVGTQNIKKDDDFIKRQDKTTIINCGDKQPVIATHVPYHASEGMSDYPNRNEKQYSRFINDRLEFHKALSDLQAASISPVLKIRGNPDLLRGFTIDSVAPHIKISNSVKEYTGYSDEQIDKLSSWEFNTNSNGSVKPSAGATIASAHLDHRKFIEKISNSEKQFLSVGQYAKVNVYSPRDYPFSQEQGLDQQYKVKLFYDGWYLVTAITHNFDGANFTQDLNLVSIDLYGLPITNKTQNNQYSKKS